MATFKGVLRELNAASRRAERESQRRARETVRQFKAQEKSQAIEDAKQAVQNWKNYIEVIQSFHKDCSAPIDWASIAQTKKPTVPEHQTTNEEIARKQQQNFKPSFWDNLFMDKLFSSISKKKEALEQALIEAQAYDKNEYETALKKHEDELSKWESLQQMASIIKNNDFAGYKTIIEHFYPFNDMGDIGSELRFVFMTDSIDINLHIHPNSVIPENVFSLTSTGKLSRKNWTKSAFNETYQDHVCSAILRVAREFFNCLPIEHVRINAISNQVNPQNGHLEEVPILSAIIPQATLEKLNFESIDPSNSMSNFIHNMKFKKTEGFQMVDKAEFQKN